MRVCVIGTGYVGLVTGACLAETGNDVTCVDIDQRKIDRLKAGHIPIYEPGLEELVTGNAEAGRLMFSSDLLEPLGVAEVVFIAVGTPPRADGGADLSAVDAVAMQIRDHADHELVVVNKSTVPVGTADRVKAIVREAKVPVHVVSNPEFLKEGAAVNDFLFPNRIVLGCDPEDEYARDVMARLYRPLNLNDNNLVWMDPVSAELTKYVANTMLAMRISFMNEMSTLCEAVGADIHSVRKGVGSDERIGSKFLFAGPGYGGSCFPKDVKALVHTGREHGLELELASTTDRVNERHKGVLMRKLRSLLGGNMRDRKVAIWGVAFKARTDDCRESPALRVIDSLLADGAQVVVHDPEALEQAREIYGDRIQYARTAYDACDGAHALVLITEWREYQNPDFDQIVARLAEPNLVDGRNIWSTYHLETRGIRYVGIGTRSADPTT